MLSISRSPNFEHAFKIFRICHKLFTTLFWNSRSLQCHLMQTTIVDCLFLNRRNEVVKLRLTCLVTLCPGWVRANSLCANGPAACVRQKQSRALVHPAGTDTHIHHRPQWTESPGRDRWWRSNVVRSHVVCPAQSWGTPWWIGCSTAHKEKIMGDLNQGLTGSWGLLCYRLNL